MTNSPAKSRLGNQPWKELPLYQYLLDLFPEHRTLCQFLDVKRLANDLELSHERVYAFLRKSKLAPHNADAIRKLACSEPNASLLIAAGRPLPERRDFDKFVYTNAA